MPRAKAQEQYYTNKELVYETIKSILKKNQSFESITNSQIISEIKKKHKYEIHYKTVSSYKSTFKKDNPNFIKNKVSNKTLAMKHRKNEPTPKAIYIEVSEEEINQLAQDSNLVFAGMVFRVNSSKKASQPEKFVFWNNSNQPTGKTTNLIPILEA